MIDGYCSLVEHDPDWPIRITAQIGERVALFRNRRDMTVQALADRCAELGLPMGRVTITKLERGMRQAVTPAEVMILALALDVPPIELFLPVGVDERIDIFPGQPLDGFSAARWFCGDLKVETLGDYILAVRRPYVGEEAALVLLEEHHRLAREFNDARSVASQWALRASGETATQEDREQFALMRATVDDLRKSHEPQLRNIRALMRRRDMRLPPVPLGLSLDDEERGKPDPDKQDGA